MFDINIQYKKSINKSVIYIDTSVENYICRDIFGTSKILRINFEGLAFIKKIIKWSFIARRDINASNLKLPLKNTLIMLENGSEI